MLPNCGENNITKKKKNKKIVVKYVKNMFAVFLSLPINYIGDSYKDLSNIKNVY